MKNSAVLLTGIFLVSTMLASYATRHISKASFQFMKLRYV